MRRTVVVIAGPTAAGKTEVAIEIARYCGTEIVSADSRQVYREMNIGTAKPSAHQLAAVRHHLIDIVSIRDPYSVGEYERDALATLEELFERRYIAVLAGGSGLYIHAVCHGLDEFPPVLPEVRNELEELWQKHGIAILQKELKKRDRPYFKTVDINNPHRLIRALSIIRTTGRPYSSYLSGTAKKRPFQTLKIQLTLPRKTLYDMINKRVDRMMEAGLLEEAKAFFPHRHLESLNTVGYRELFHHLEGAISLEEAIDLIKRNTRRYAKRQITWFRKRDYTSFHPAEVAQMISFIEGNLEET